MKTLKYEEVLRIEYRDLAEARASIVQFIEKIHNRISAAADIGRWAMCRPPRSRRNWRRKTRRLLRGSWSHEFFEASAIQQSDGVAYAGGEEPGSCPAANRLDESQLSFPRQGAQQQSRLSLHLPGLILAQIG
jgi:hypothetical protein